MRSREHAPALLATMHSLAVDAVTVDVLAALDDGGIEAVLLKGPAIGALLYPEGQRNWTDADVLVPTESVGEAEGVLGRLGFERGPVAVEPELGLPHAVPWRRPGDPVSVDLHVTLAGAAVAPAQTWRVLRAQTTTLRIGPMDCRVLQPQALVMLVALHAAQHGEGVERPLEDLRRAIETQPLERWQQAAALAERLEALINFSSALRMLPEGARLSRELDLPSPDLVDAARGSRSVTRLALGFDRLGAAAGPRAKFAMAARELVPSPSHMRWWSSLARRGVLGLAAAYVLRAVRLVVLAIPGLVAWRRHRGRAA